MPVELRDYQQKAVDDVRVAMRQHRRVLLCSPTGSGKTVIFSHIAERVWSRGEPVLIRAHRIEIVEQIGAALARNGVRHGIIAPGYRESSWPVQVGMVQTIQNRIGRIPKPRLLVTDECHHAVANSYKTPWDDVYELGVTATPARLDGKGLGGAYDVLVMGPSMRDLQARGFLSRYQYFAPPVVANIDAISKRAGDYSATEAAAAMDQRSVTGDIVGHYAKMMPGRPAKVFCVSVDHAKHMADAFRRAGYRAESVDGSMQKDERRRLIASIGDGRLDVLCSCDIISEGTDIPAIAGVVLARPTLSIVIFMQQVGRGLRPKPDGSPTIILDHVGNVLKHGLPNADREWTLEGAPKRVAAAAVKVCPECYLSFPPAPKCPACGHVLVVASVRTPPKQVAGDLQEFSGDMLDKFKTTPIRTLLAEHKTEAELRTIARVRGYHPRWVGHVMRESGYKKKVASP